MMDGILSPAFLQAACAHKQEEPEQPVVINLKALQAEHRPARSQSQPQRAARQAHKRHTH